MTLTPTYKLKKPDGHDALDVDVLSENFQKIDEVMSSMVSNSLASVNDLDNMLISVFGADEVASWNLDQEPVVNAT